MSYKFNPLTGKLELDNSLTIKEAIKAILVESKDDGSGFPKVSILFDEDSILYNDDCEKAVK